MVPGWRVLNCPICLGVETIRNRNMEDPPGSIALCTKCKRDFEWSVKHEMWVEVPKTVLN
jgi:hypothetical protein